MAFSWTALATILAFPAARAGQRLPTMPADKPLKNHDAANDHTPLANVDQAAPPPLPIHDYGPYVYVLAGDGSTVKIGISLDPQKRCREIRGASGRDLSIAFLIRSPKAAEIERITHARLAEFRALGEWFRVSAEDAASHVVAVAATFGDGCAVVDDLSDFEIAPHVPKAMHFGVVAAHCAKHGLVDGIAAHDATPPSVATRRFAAMMCQEWEGESITFPSVVAAYEELAIAHNWPTVASKAVSPKAISQALKEYGCISETGNRRKDGSRPSVVTFRNNKKLSKRKRRRRA